MRIAFRVILVESSIESTFNSFEYSTIQRDLLYAIFDETTMSINYRPRNSSAFALCGYINSRNSVFFHNQFFPKQYFFYSIVKFNVPILEFLFHKYLSTDNFTSALRISFVTFWKVYSFIFDLSVSLQRCSTNIWKYLEEKWHIPSIRGNFLIEPRENVRL